MGNSDTISKDGRLLFSVRKSRDWSLFFDDDTINRQNSHSTLKESFVPELKRLGKENSVIFQQRGAPTHFSQDVRRYFEKSLC